VQHSASLTRECGDDALAEAVASGNFETLDHRRRALCMYAVKLTRTPAQVVKDDLSALRDVGLDDRAIVDANQVISYFNYVNRVADGLGVELEADWSPEARKPRSYPLAEGVAPRSHNKHEGAADEYS
jgi:uncharacterized peroxidase-related enzyme